MSNRYSLTAVVTVVVGWFVTVAPNLSVWFSISTDPHAARVSDLFKGACGILAVIAITVFSICVYRDSQVDKKAVLRIKALAKSVRTKLGGGSEYAFAVQDLVTHLFTADMSLFRFESAELCSLLTVLDKHRPGRDEITQWSTPTRPEFDLAVKNLLNLLERQLTDSSVKDKFRLPRIA